MYFSAKITHSVLNFLANNGVDPGRLLEHTELPTEFLSDPTYWLEADKVESFLSVVVQECGSQFIDQNFLEKIGHESKQLKAWGALDSVLKMMSQPEDIFLQPQRFISYFVSPPPPIGDIVRSDSTIEFEIPISSLEFPHVTDYLRSALESIPLFMGAEMARVEWKSTHLKLKWSKPQAPLFVDDKQQVTDPNFLQSLVASLEKAEKEIARKNRELYEKEQMLGSLSLSSVEQKSSIPLKTMAELKSEVLRLTDYVTRFQQLLTLLSTSDKLSPSMKDIMRRLDWDRIKKEIPLLSNSVNNRLFDLETQLSGQKKITLAENSKRKEAVHLSELIGRAIQEVRGDENKESKLSIEKMLFFESPIELVEREFEGTIRDILLSCVEGQDSNSIRIMTRPIGQRAEIEISDLGSGLDSEKFLSSSRGQRVSRVLQEHSGHLEIVSELNEGTTFRLNLPIQ